MANNSYREEKRKKVFKDDYIQRKKKRNQKNHVAECISPTPNPTVAPDELLFIRSLNRLPSISPRNPRFCSPITLLTSPVQT
jgi:hypothetical protein